MNPEFWRGVQSFGYIFATVAMTAFGVVFVAVAHSLVGKMNEMRRELAANRSDLGMNRRYCPTCKAITMQASTLVIGAKQLVTKCTGCSQERPL